MSIPMDSSLVFKCNTALLDKMDAAYRRMFWDQGKTITTQGFYLANGNRFGDDNIDESRDYFPGIGMFGMYDPDGPFVKISREVFEPSLCVYLIQMMLAQFDIYVQGHRFGDNYGFAPLDAMVFAIEKTLEYITQSHKDGIIKCDDDYWYWGSK